MKNRVSTLHKILYLKFLVESLDSVNTFLYFKCTIVYAYMQVLRQSIK